MTTSPSTRDGLAARRRAALATGTGTPAGVTLDGNVAASTSGAFLRFRWGLAPAGLATRRQRAAARLRPGAPDPVARIVWRRGSRFADLYPVARAVPKADPTPAQLAGLAAALRARSTCTGCGTVADYCLPTRNGRQCADCDPATYTTGSAA